MSLSLNDVLNIIESNNEARLRDFIKIAVEPGHQDFGTAATGMASAGVAGTAFGRGMAKPNVAPGAVPAPSTGGITSIPGNVINSIKKNPVKAVAKGARGVATLGVQVLADEAADALIPKFDDSANGGEEGAGNIFRRYAIAAGTGATVGAGAGALAGGIGAVPGAIGGAITNVAIEAGGDLWDRFSPWSARNTAKAEEAQQTQNIQNNIVNKQNETNQASINSGFSSAQAHANYNNTAAQRGLNPIYNGDKKTVYPTMANTQPQQPTVMPQPQPQPQVA